MDADLYDLNDLIEQQSSFLRELDFHEERIAGYGLDGVNDNDLNPNGWETHFVIGQNF